MQEAICQIQPGCANLPRDAMELQELVKQANNLWWFTVAQYSTIRKNGHCATASIMNHSIWVAQINSVWSATVMYELQKVAEELHLDLFCVQKPYTWHGSLLGMPISAQIASFGGQPYRSKRCKILSKGFPQGSICGPLFWCIMI